MILITREFEAPIQLVFDVFTKTEHVRPTHRAVSGKR